MILALQQMIKGYEVEDPPTKKEAAIPLNVFKEAYLRAQSTAEKQLTTLVIGEFFFGCQSCEYLAVSGTRKTMVIRLANIQFFWDNTEIGHRANTTAQSLEKEDIIAITFRLQKNNE